MSAFISELRTEFQSRVPYTIWAVLTVVLSVTGAFGSRYSYSIVGRSLLWAVVMAVSIVVGTVLRTLVNLSFRTVRVRLRSVMIAALVSLVLTPFLKLLSNSFVVMAEVSHPDVSEIAFVVASVSLAISALRVQNSPVAGLELGFTEAPPDQDAAADDLRPEPVQSRLMLRLDPALRGELWSISVRDHYVDVRTSRGQASLLLRLSDAIAEAAPADGAQVHRSHWVAWAGVAGVDREGAKVFLQLRHGIRVPVSKNHREKLVARGLL